MRDNQTRDIFKKRKSKVFKNLVSYGYFGIALASLGAVSLGLTSGVSADEVGAAPSDSLVSSESPQPTANLADNVGVASPAAPVVSQADATQALEPAQSENPGGGSTNWFYSRNYP